MKPKNGKMTFCLRQILHEKGISIVQLSKMSGISSSNLSNYMNGKISPTLETLYKIAEALNVDITELFKKREDIVLLAKYNGKTIEINKEDLIKYIKEKEGTNDQPKDNK